MSNVIADKPLAIGFLLVPGFALMSYTSAIEPLRAANMLAGKTLYQWQHFSPDGGTATASTGVGFSCASATSLPESLDLLIVCAGGNPALFDHAPTFAALRRLAGRGTRIAGVSGGPFILASAGIMRGRHMTIHWEHAEAFAERFPDHLLTRSRYIIDRDRLTCAGGIAPLDMMHALVSEQHGASLARQVTDWFLHTDIRPAGDAQRASLAERYGIHRRELVSVLELMENNLAQPVARSVAASHAGLSIRQLDRLFASQMGTTFASHYKKVRLTRARDLLRQSTLPITEIALACGFSSVSHFSRTYTSHYAAPPSSERNRKS